MSGPEDVWLGVDLGTQSVRVMAVAGDGRVLAGAARPLTGTRPAPNRHEQNPRDWWDAFRLACRAVMAELRGAAVRALAIDGTSGTVLLIDRDGQPLTMGLMYDDGRATEQARLASDAGADLWRSLGYQRMQPTWGLPKLIWLLREHPELSGSARLAHQADFITRRLAGHDVPTDSSNALKTGYDPWGESWPWEVMSALKIPPALLPPVVRPGSIIGMVGDVAASETGIPMGTAVIAGMTDGCAGQIAAGSLREGSWNCVLGTTLIFKGVTNKLLRDPLGLVYSHRSPDGNWLPGAASNTGAGILTRDFVAHDLDALGEAASRRPPSAHVAYPLANRGERFPFDAPHAEGFFIGAPRDDIDRYAAMLQGIACVERLCFDYLDLIGAATDGDLIFTGGATRSPYWCQLRSDILQRPVMVPQVAEPAFGMAILAAANGQYLADAADSMVRIRDVHEPRMVFWRQLHEMHGQFIDELVQRGYISEQLARHAKERAR